MADFVKLLELIKELDDNTILLPHNKDALKAVNLSELHTLQASKIREFFDYIAEPWGTANKQQFHITVSFYLQTNVISSTLTEIYTNADIKAHSTHNGHQVENYSAHAAGKF